MAQQQANLQAQQQPSPKPRAIDWTGDIQLDGFWVPHNHMLQNATTSVMVGGRVQAGTVEGIVTRMFLMRNGHIRCEFMQGASPREKNPGKPRFVVFTPPFYAVVSELTE